MTTTQTVVFVFLFVLLLRTRADFYQTKDFTIWSHCSNWNGEGRVLASVQSTKALRYINRLCSASYYSNGCWVGLMRINGSYQWYNPQKLNVDLFKFDENNLKIIDPYLCNFNNNNSNNMDTSYYFINNSNANDICWQQTYDASLILDACIVGPQTYISTYEVISNFVFPLAIGVPVLCYYLYVFKGFLRIFIFSQPNYAGSPSYRPSLSMKVTAVLFLGSVVIGLISGLIYCAMSLIGMYITHILPSDDEWSNNSFYPWYYEVAMIAGAILAVLWLFSSIICHIHILCRVDNLCQHNYEHKHAIVESFKHMRIYFAFMIFLIILNAIATVLFILHQGLDLTVFWTIFVIALWFMSSMAINGQFVYFYNKGSHYFADIYKQLALERASVVELTFLGFVFGKKERYLDDREHQIMIEVSKHFALFAFMLCIHMLLMVVWIIVSISENTYGQHDQDAVYYINVILAVFVLFLRDLLIIIAIHLSLPNFHSSYTDLCCCCERLALNICEKSRFDRSIGLGRSLLDTRTINSGDYVQEIDLSNAPMFSELINSEHAIVAVRNSVELLEYENNLKRVFA